MQNYNSFIESLNYRIIGNLVLVTILLVFIICITIKIIKNSKIIKNKKYVNMFKYCSSILVCMMLVFFIIMFFISLVFNCTVKYQLINDLKENRIASEIIELNNSMFSNKTKRLYIDKDNENIKYYFFENISDDNSIEIITGDRYLITYFQSSKVIIEINNVN